MTIIKSYTDLSQSHKLAEIERRRDLHYKNYILTMFNEISLGILFFISTFAL